jgi:ATP-dependent Zn protease
VANLKRSLPKIPAKSAIPNPFKARKSSNKSNNKLLGLIKGLGVYLLIGLAALIFFAGLQGNSTSKDDAPISQVVSDVRDQLVEKIVVEGDKVEVTYRGDIQDENKKGKTVTARKEAGESIYQILEASQVDPKTVAVEVKDISWQQGWISLLGTLIPVILMIVFFLLIFRQARDAGQGIVSYRESKAVCLKFNSEKSWL